MQSTATLPCRGTLVTSSNWQSPQGSATQSVAVLWKRITMGDMSQSTDPSEISFLPFYPRVEFDLTRRNLPHWFQPGATVFLTFLTMDSMPRRVVEGWLAEQRAWLEKHGFDPSAAQDLSLLNGLPQVQQNEFRRLRDRLWHYALDSCHGACVLRQREMSTIVAETLLYFNSERYHLDSFVVMPNHVHLLAQFIPPTTMRSQSTSWLRFSATKINKLLDKKGAFWRPEPFDNLVRSAEQFEYLRRYIRENPLKANLRQGDFFYWSR